MTRKEAIKIFNTVLLFGKCDCPKEEIEECLKMAIQALDQEPRKDEVILTKKEYGELVSSEFDNGYTKGYTEALEQNDVLDKIRAEIDSYCSDNRDRNDGLYIAMRIIDKYRESEENNDLR